MTPRLYTYGVAGPRDLTERGSLLVVETIRALRDCYELVSGCAYGVDGVAARAAEAQDPAVIPLVRLTVPCVLDRTGAVRVLPCDRTLIRHALDARQQGDERWVVETAAPGRTALDGYRRRDQLTVARSLVLLAFPKTPVEELRSGTWMTVRLARKAGIEVRFFPLDGSDPWVELARTPRLLV